VKAEYSNHACEDDVDDLWSAETGRGRQICGQKVVRLSDEADVGEENGQYRHQDVDRAFEQGDDRRKPGQGIDTDGTEDAETIVEILIQRHRIKHRHADT